MQSNKVTNFVKYLLMVLCAVALIGGTAALSSGNARFVQSSSVQTNAELGNNENSESTESNSDSEVTYSERVLMSQAEEVSNLSIVAGSPTSSFVIETDDESNADEDYVAEGYESHYDMYLTFVCADDAEFFIKIYFYLYADETSWFARNWCRVDRTFGITREYDPDYDEYRMYITGYNGVSYSISNHWYDSRHGIEAIRFKMGYAARWQRPKVLEFTSYNNADYIYLNAQAQGPVTVGTEYSMNYRNSEFQIALTGQRQKAVEFNPNGGELTNIPNTYSPYAGDTVFATYSVPLYAFPSNDNAYPTVGRDYVKTNSGSAYVALWKNTSNNYVGPLLVSQTQSAVTYKALCTGNSWAGPWSSVGSFTYLGKTYYYAGGEYSFQTDYYDSSYYSSPRVDAPDIQSAALKLLRSKVITINSAGIQIGTLPTPTRTGYTFDGWYTTAETSGGTKLTTTQTFNSQDCVTYYARWKKKTAATFSPNGGTLSGLANNLVTVSTAGQTIATINGVTYTKTNAGTAYVVTILKGVNSYNTGPVLLSTDRNAVAMTVNGTNYTYGSSGTINGTTYYLSSTSSALFQSGEFLDISVNGVPRLVQTFNAISVSNLGKAILNSIVLDVGAPLSSVLSSLPTPTRSGYRFDGWFTAASGGTQINLSAIPSSTQAGVCYYAHWTKLITYTLDANGGSVSPSSMICDYGTTVTNLPTPTRTGYTFKGWGIEDASNNPLNLGVGYQYQDFSGCFYAYREDWQDVDSTAKLSIISCAGFSDSYGWKIYVKGDRIYLSGGLLTKSVYVTNDLSPGWHLFTFMFKGTSNYSLSLSVDGVGSVAGVSSNPSLTYTFTDNLWIGAEADSSSYVSSESLSGVKIANFQIYNDTGTHAGSFNAFTVANQNATLKALWQVNSYTVTLDTNYPSGSSGGTAGTTSVTATYDAAMPAITKPTRNGYDFQGYYDILTGTYYYNADGSSARTWNKAANTTLYARWTQAVYTVTLDKQSGSGGTTTIYEKYDTGWYSNSGATSLITRVTVPTRSGYSFEGYYTNTGGGGTQIINRTGAILSDKTTTFNHATTRTGTLYAKWVNVYAITLNTNGGSGGTATIYELKGVGFSSDDAGRTLITTITKPTRANYTYSGHTASAGSGISYINSSGTITAGNTTWSAAATIYAQWTPNVYTITLNGNSPTTAGTTVVYEKYATGFYSDSACTTAITTITRPLKTNYTFTGYGSSLPPTGATRSNTTMSLPANTTFTGNTTLTAGWVETWKVTFDRQSGTGGTTELYLKKGDAYYQYFANSIVETKKTSITVPTRTGYTFGGYFNGTGGSGTQYINANGTFTSNFSNTAFTAAKTIYAKWTAKTYAVTLNKNATDATAGTASVTATYNAAMPSATMPTRTGYNFAGYYDTNAASGGTQYYTAAGASARSWNKTADTILYARWTANTYSITYNQGTGLGKYDSGTLPSAATATYDQDFTLAPNDLGKNNANGSTFTLTFNTNKPSGATATPAVSPTSKTGTQTKSYTAAGWVTASAGTGNAVAQSYTPWKRTSGYTLYPKFNETVTNPTVSGFPTPTLTGWTFAGWYDAASGGNKITSKTLSANATVWAHWTALTYSVKFNGNGNTGGSMSNQTLTYDTAANLTANAFTRSGYTFAGWSNLAATATVAATGASSTGTDTALGASYPYYIKTASDNSWAGPQLPSTYVTPGKTYTWSLDVYVTGTKDVINRFDYNVSASNKSGNDAGYQNVSISPSTIQAGRWVTISVTCTIVSDAESPRIHHKSAPYRYVDNTDFGTEGLKIYYRNSLLYCTENVTNPTDARYANQASVKNLASTQGAVVNLYAIWTTNAYNLTIKPNDGSIIVGGTTYTVDATLTGNIGQFVTVEAGSRTGYHTNGAALTGSGTLSGSNYPYTFTYGAGAATLTANWTANTYSVTYNQGTGLGKYDTGTLPSTGTATYKTNFTLATNSLGKSEANGTSYTLTYNVNKPSGASGTVSISKTSDSKAQTKSYTRAGWVTSSDGTGNAVAQSYTPWTRTSGLTLYPKFTETVTNPTFNNFPTPTLSGYTFLGWFAAASGGTAITSKQIGANTSIYAHWSVNSYTVTLNANGGTGGTASVTATYDAAMPSATMPTRTGYTFQGYYDTNAASGGTQYYTAAGASARTWNKSANTTLYARWTIINYTLTIMGNGGTIAATAAGGDITKINDSQFEARTMQYGTGRFSTLELTFTREGYTFNGLWTAASGGVQVYNNTNPKAYRIAGTDYWNSSGQWIYANNHTVYAQWTINPYTVTIQPADGLLLVNYTNTSGTSTNVYVRANTNLTVNYNTTVKVNRFTRVGYTGSLAKTGSGTWNSSNNTLTVGAGNSTITASWTIKNVTLNVDASGGALPSGVSASVTQQYGTSLTIGNPTRTGYTFKGWVLTKSAASATWVEVYHNNALNGAAAGLFKDGSTKIDLSTTAVNDLNRFSMLNKLDTLKTSSSNWEFMLEYPQLSSSFNRWTQTANPATAAANNEVGYTEVGTQAWTSNSWKGLARSSSTNDTFIDGSPKAGSWFYAIGPYSGWSGAIPGPAEATNHVRLWVKAADANLSNINLSGINDTTDALTSANVYYFRDDAVTLKALWSINSYTITVQPNGGTVGVSVNNGTASNITANTNYTVNYGGTVKIASASHTGYDLASISKTGEGTLSSTTSVPSTLTVGAGNATVAVNWNYHPYTLTIKPNGGTIVKNLAYMRDSSEATNTRIKYSSNNGVITATGNDSSNTDNYGFCVNSGPFADELKVNTNYTTTFTYTSSQGTTLDAGWYKYNDVWASRIWHQGIGTGTSGNATATGTIGGSTPVTYKYVFRVDPNTYQNVATFSNIAIYETNATYTTDQTIAIPYNHYYYLVPPTREGYNFTGWTVSGTGSTINGNLLKVGTANPTVTANWSIKTYTITATPNDAALGTVTGGGTYNHGASVTLTATPSSDKSEFVNWTEGSTVLGTSTTLTINPVTASRNIRANFRALSSTNGDVTFYIGNINETNKTCILNRIVVSKANTAVEIPVAVNGYTIVGIRDGTDKDYLTYLEAKNASVPYNNIDPDTTTKTNISSLTFASGSQIAYIGNRAFMNCSNVAGNITIPACVTRIGDRTFGYMRNLTGITLASGSVLNTIGFDAFNLCDKMATFSELPATLTKIGGWSFSRTYALQSLSVNSSNPAFQSTNGIIYSKKARLNGNYAEYHNVASPTYGANEFAVACPSGKTGSWENTSVFTSNIKTCMYGAFWGANKITGVITIPSGMTTIPYDAFRECKGATNVIIPSTTTRINRNAFYDCYGFNTRIVIPASVVAMEAATFRYIKNCPEVVFMHPTISSLVFTGTTKDQFTGGKSGVVYAFRDTQANVNAWLDGNSNPAFSTTHFTNTNWHRVFKVTYNAGKGAWASGQPADQYVIDNAMFTPAAKTVAKVKNNVAASSIADFYWSSTSNDADGSLRFKANNVTTVVITSDLTLYAQYVFSITLNGNSATTQAAPTPLYLKYGVAYYGAKGSVPSANPYTDNYYNTPKTALTTRPARTGYTYLGLYSAQTGGTQTIDANGTIVADTDGKVSAVDVVPTNTTWYAQWSANNYTISFDSPSLNNWLTSGSYSIRDSGDTFSSTISDGHRIGTFTKNVENAHTTTSGIWFAGSNIENGTAITWSAYARVTSGTLTITSFGWERNCAKSVTLNTTWQRIDFTGTAGSSQYYQFIAYCNNWVIGNVMQIKDISIKTQFPSDENTYQGVYRGTYNMADLYATYDAALPELTTVPTRDGYTFGGYYTGKNGTGTQYYDANGVRNVNTYTLTNNITLYSKWTANTYTVALSQQGGIGGTSSVTVTYEQPMPSATMPTRVGYTFQGYYGQANGAGDKYYNANGTSARSWPHASGGTVYAYWLKNSYNLTLNANGGSVSTTSMNNIPYNTLVTNLPTPTKAGYTFMGWGITTTGTVATSLNYGRDPMYTDNLSVHVRAYKDDWTADSNWHSIISNTQSGGYAIGYEASSKNTIFAEVYDSGYKAVTCTNDLTPGWHDFDMVYNSSTKTLTFYIDGVSKGTATTPTSVLKYNASNVTWAGAEANGGTGVATANGFNGIVANPIIANDTTLRGGDASRNTILMPAQNATLYAQWQANTYTIKYVGDGANGGNYSVNGNSVAYNSNPTQVVSCDSVATLATNSATKNAQTRKYTYTFKPTSSGTEYTHLDSNGTRGYTANGWLPGTNINYTTARYGTTNTTVTTTIAETTQLGSGKYVLNLNTTDGAVVTLKPNFTLAASWTQPQITFPAHTIATKTGYTCIGWNTAENATTAQYTAGQKVTPSANVTYYPVWQANTYTVTFNANGGGTPDPTSKTVTYDGTYGTLATVSRAGYSFGGWFTAATGGTQVTANTKVTITAAQILYAHWSANNYTVHFNGNGATDGSMGDQIFTYDTAQAISDNLFQKTGYNFAGWNTKADGTGTSYSNKQSATNIAGTAAETTLYAQWTAVELKPAIRYNLGTATGGTVPASQNAAYDSTVTLATNNLTKARTNNYVTITYNVNAPSGLPSGVTPSLTTTDANTKVNNYVDYAAQPGWSVNQGRTTIDQGYGNGAQVVVKWTSVKDLYPVFSTSTGVTPATLPAPTLTGYTFIGWFTDSACTTPVNEQGGAAGSTFGPAANITVYAKWTINNYTLTIMGNGGTITATNQGGDITKINDSQFEARTMQYGTGRFSTLELTFTREGYTFNGLWTATSGGVQVYNNTNPKAYRIAGTDYWNSDGKWIYANNHTVYAHWTCNGYTVTVNANGGTLGGGDAGITLDSATQARFGTLFDQQNYRYLALTFARTGYTFTGLFDAATGGTQVYEVGTSYRIAKAGTTYWDANQRWIYPNNLTIYAQWTANNYTVTFNANGGSTPNPATKAVAFDGTYGTLATTSRTGYTLNGFSLVPNGYEQLEYIQGTGTQYIETNISTPNGMVAVYGAEFQSNTYIIGSHNANSPYGRNGAYIHQENVQWELGYGDGTKKFANAELSKFNTYYDVEFSTINQNAWLKVNGTMLGSDLRAMTISSNHLMILQNSYGVARNTAPGRAKVYYAGVYDSSRNLLAYYVPAKRTSDNAIGMFDIVSGTFLENSGTGEFVAGPTTYVTASTKLGIAANHTLYAHWTANNYTVTFNANGGSTPDPTSKTVTYDATYGALATTTRTGYTFNGWFTDATAGTQVTASTTVAITANQTLYAHWTANTYHVNYNVQDSSLGAQTGTTGGSVQVGSTAYNYVDNQDTIYSQPAVYDANLTIGTNNFTRENDTGLNYTVTYNGNGGKISGSLDSDVQISYGTRSYTANGWNTLPNGTGTAYANNYAFTPYNIANDINLYPVYTQGSWTFPAVNGFNATRTGYTFNGWFDAQTGGNKITFPYTPSSDIELFAHWTAKSYTITMDANTGTVTTTNTLMTQVDATHVTMILIYDSNRHNILEGITFEKTGYSITGLYDAATAGKQVYSYNSANGRFWRTAGTGYWSTNSTWIHDGAPTLYAQWQANTYTVTFNANGGNTPNPTSKTVTYDGTYGTLATTARTGYTFNGWFTEQTGGTQVTESTTVAITTDQTLYAHWTANTYTVTFNANGGSTPDPTSKTVTYDGTYGTLATTTRTGYTFNGWFTDATAGTQITANTTVAITTDQILYAHWTANTYTVTFNANGGSTPDPTSKTVTYDGTYGTLATTTRTGYTFNGWFTDATAGTQVTASTTVAITTDQILYAHWTVINYTLTIMANGGTATATNESLTQVSETQVEARTMQYGTNRFNGLYITFARTGYTFNGLWTATSGGVQVYNSTNPNPSRIPGTAYWNNSDEWIYADNLTVYAQWTANTYTVTFDKNNTDTGSAAPTPATKDVTYGETYGTLATVSRTGYTFAGWFTDATGGTQVSTNTQVLITANQTLFAHWNINSYTITIDPNGGTFNITHNGSTFDVSSVTQISMDYRTSFVINSATRPNYTLTTLTRNGPLNLTQSLPPSTYTSGAGEATISAEWAPKTYRIDLFAQNDLQNIGNTPIFERYTNGYYLTETGGSAITQISTPTYAGHTFRGYYTQQNPVLTTENLSSALGEQVIAANGNILKANTYFNDANTTNGQTSLYALWTLMKYDVTIQPNGAAVNITYTNPATGTTESSTITAETTISLNYNSTLNVNSATRVGYNMSGITLTGLGSLSNSSTVPTVFTVGSSPAELVFNWIAKTYTVTVNSNTGTITNTNPNITNDSATQVHFTVTYDANTNSNLTNIAFNKIGYTFTGLFTTTTDAGVQVYNAMAQSAIPCVSGTGYWVDGLWNYDDNVTLYAHYTINSYTITGTPNNANYGSVTGSGTYEYGTQWSLTAVPANDFCEFVEWQEGDSTSTYSTNATITGTTGVTNRTFTAIFRTTTAEIDGTYFYYTVTSEQNKTCTLNRVVMTQSGTLTIPDTLNGYTITAMRNGSRTDNITYLETADPNVSYNKAADTTTRTRITGVVFNCSHCTNIGKDAFYNCTNLTGTLTIPNSVTTIDQEAFRNTKITRAELGTGVTAINWAAFFSCAQLSYVNIPASVTFIGSTVFGHTYSLTTFDFNTNNNAYVLYNDIIYTKNYSTIVSCPGGKVDVWSTDGAINTNIFREGTTILTTGAFCGAKFITGTLILPSTITAIPDSTFEGCLGTTEVKFHDNLTTIGNYAFVNCSGINTRVVIPASVTQINTSAFFNCNGMPEVLFMHPSISTLSLGTNNEFRNGKSDVVYMFRDTQANVTAWGNFTTTHFTNTNWHYATKVTFNANGGNVTPEPVYGWNKFTTPTSVSDGEEVTIFLESWNTNALDTGTSYNINTEYDVPAVDTTLYAIWTKARVLVGNAYYTFTITDRANHTCRLDSVAMTERGALTVPNTLLGYTITSMKDGGYGTTGENVGVFVPSAGYMTSIDLSNLTSLTNIGAYAFFSTSVPSITIPSTVTTLSLGAFWNNNSIATMNIPASVTNIDGAFGANANLTAFTVDNANTTYKVVNDAIYTTNGTTLVAYPTGKASAWADAIPSGVTTIATAAFRGANNMTGNFELPSTLTYIGGEAFNGANISGELILPNGVQVVEWNAFMGVGITKLVIPATVTRIAGAFNNCASLTRVHFLHDNISSLTLLNNAFTNGNANVVYAFYAYESAVNSWGRLTSSAFTNTTYHQLYKVSYDANGGDATFENFFDIANATYTTPTQAGTYTENSNYRITGWNTARNSSGTQYGLGIEYNIPAQANHDFTLYATWHSPIAVNLTSNLYSVTLTGESADIPYNTTHTVSAVNENASFRFVGWYNATDYAASSSTATRLSENATYTFTVTENITLIAVYEYAGSTEIHIEHLADLTWLANTVNGGITLSGVTCYLDRSLNLSEIGDATWTSIGNATYKFAGTFNGLGYTITSSTNLKLFADGTTADVRNLFIGGSLNANVTITIEDEYLVNDENNILDNNTQDGQNQR